MRCRYVKTIFQNKENGYCIFLYETEDTSVPEQVKSKQTGKAIRFTAIGNNLPDTDSIELNMLGNWVKSKFGLQFQVETYEEILPQTIEGITGYLSSGLIKGIGPKTAELIVGRFGTRTFEIFDQYPDNLLQIKGITEKKLNIIMDSYHGSHAVRDLAAYLTPFHVTPNKIQKIYEQFGSESLETVKKQPFMLCQISGFGFLTVDEIAKSSHCRLNDPMRIEGCIHYCMELITQEGHLYQEKEIIQKKVWEQLNHGYSKEVVSEAEISRELYRLVQEGVLYFEDGALYPEKLYYYECDAAKDLAELLVQDTEDMSQIDNLIAEAQKDLGILLAAKQAEAVKKAFCHLVSIITGGPGTGKTTVQKVILYVNEKLGGKRVLLTAPTGRASRRMSESTGYPDAMTMHSAMGLNSEEDCEAMIDQFEEELVLADEFTMSDMRLSWEFFRHIKKGARLVLIGDVNQLPSVGPGNVFRELVTCGVIPVTVLDMVFRQAGNSRIAMNAHKMLENSAQLDYGEEFEFIQADSTAEAAEKIEEIYCREVNKYGLDHVQVLSPFRKRGEASVDALNAVLWELMNPKAVGKAEIKSGKRTFRVGDRIIQNKNQNQISNGDIGYVEDIYLDEDGVPLAKLIFSEGRTVEYGSDELELIEHAYVTTVHKSQGSEYKVVILPWLPMFYMMLRRNILYTAITRAKVAVKIVGSKQAIYKAVHNTECDKRNTRLGERVVREYNRLVAKKQLRMVQSPCQTHEKYEQMAVNL
ncbi:MAG: ATP-dependent RecD-like DNA helicase [Lachnospiraceae bacterium]|nr:ATP-dependent RecD-like DNA helicase [Lachnospiraceae bacterium]MBR3826009.1 ATP-dependent RecD-like DNA helicase [Lachnospiraceae bacterium]